MTRVGQVGLGVWGSNLARNVDELADLVARAPIVVDFRNATRGHESRGRVWKL